MFNLCVTRVKPIAGKIMFLAFTKSSLSSLEGNIINFIFLKIDSYGFLLCQLQTIVSDSKADLDSLSFGRMLNM